MSEKPDADPVTALHERFTWLPPEVAAEVRAAVDEVRKVWPTIVLPLPTFEAHVQRSWASATTHGSIGARVRDLWLACACAAGDPEAVRILDKNVLRRVAPALRGMRQGPDFVDEILQSARERLVVGVPTSADGRPRIADYQGLGPLERWVRVFVVRLALSTLRGHDAPLPDDEGGTTDAVAPDLERQHLHARYATWFQDTIKRVFAELPADDRALVELTVKERLPMSEIGARLKLDKSTISRRMTAIRVRMFDALQGLAQAELRVSPAEYASLVQALRSQLDLSLGLVPKNSST